MDMDAIPAGAALAGAVAFDVGKSPGAAPHADTIISANRVSTILERVCLIGTFNGCKRVWLRTNQAKVRSVSARALGWRLSETLLTPSILGS